MRYVIYVATAAVCVVLLTLGFHDNIFVLLALLLITLVVLLPAAAYAGKALAMEHGNTVVDPQGVASLDRIKGQMPSHWSNEVFLNATQAILSARKAVASKSEDTKRLSQFEPRIIEAYKKWVTAFPIESSGQFAMRFPHVPHEAGKIVDEMELAGIFLSPAPRTPSNEYAYSDLSNYAAKYYFPLLLSQSTKIDIPKATRYEHAWCLAPQGSGKTQLIQKMVADDILEIMNKKLTVLVIDSQGDLIRNLSTLQYVQEHIVLVEPERVALNPFDLKGDRAVDLLTYVFGALGEGAEFTPKQATLYRYCIRLLQEIPGATLNTFVEILHPNGLMPYVSYISNLSESAQAFFTSQFDDPKQFTQTKQELGWRLMLLLENPVFERMFCAPKTKLDLFTLTKPGHLILIDTSKEKLGTDRSSIFGRFFIALLLHVSQSRAATKDRSPIYVYIDEAHEYLADDTVADILDQARKMKIGMFLANQRSAQIKNPNMRDALLTTSIKFVHTDNDSDTHLLSRVMKVLPEDIAGLPRQVFDLYVRGTTSKAVPITVPFGVVEGLPHIDGYGLQSLRDRMNASYGRDDGAPATKEPPSPPAPDTTPESSKKPKPKKKPSDTKPKPW